MSAASGEAPRAYCAIRLDGELDIIVFSSGEDCGRFCLARPEYSPMVSAIYSLQDALSLFGGEA